jgi:hypothetical protein
VNRLKPNQIASHRQELVERQGNLCPLCQTEFRPGDIIHLDHCHRTGYVRAALHGTCNLGLGKVERAARMTRNPENFTRNLAAYIETHQLHPSGVFHPSHLTADERRERRQKRAKRKRAEGRASGQDG